MIRKILIYFLEFVAVILFFAGFKVPVLFLVMLGIGFVVNLLRGTPEFKKVTIDLGQIVEFNDVVQKFIKTNDKITVNALQRDFTIKEEFTKSNSNLKYVYKDISLIVKDRSYTIHDIKRFEIIESDSIKKSHEIDNTINGRSISSSASYSRALAESRRLLICFSDGECFTLSDVDNRLALGIELAIIQKDSAQ